jgi:hypothetical protein
VNGKPSAALQTQNRRGDDRAHHQRGIVVLHHARVIGGIGDHLALARGRDAADDSFAEGKLLRFEHLLDEARPPRAEFLRVGQRAVRREQALDGHAAHHVVGALFENAGAERAGAEDRGMHDALEKLVAIQSLTHGVDHAVHELQYHRPLLEQGKFFLLLARRLVPGLPVKDQDQQRPDATTEQKKHHRAAV